MTQLFFEADYLMDTFFLDETVQIIHTNMIRYRTIVLGRKNRFVIYIRTDLFDSLLDRR